MASGWPVIRLSSAHDPPRQLRSSRGTSRILLSDTLASMTTAEVATQLVALCREGKFVDAIETLYAHHVVSVEAMDYQGMGREMHGKEAVKGKNVGWFENNDVHSVSVTGPFVSPERFAVLYSFDWTSKASGERVQLNEVAVYTVVDGKIAHEEFLYSAGQ